MALFRKRKGSAKADTSPLVGRTAYCRICDADQTFTQCWRRLTLLTKCPCCGLEFENPGKIYSQHKAVCPQCDEPLEQPNFDYGACDACGSKYEIVENTKPGLLPNKEQRDAMNIYGRSRDVR